MKKPKYKIYHLTYKINKEYPNNKDVAISTLKHFSKDDYTRFAANLSQLVEYIEYIDMRKKVMYGQYYKEVGAKCWVKTDGKEYPDECWTRDELMNYKEITKADMMLLML